MSSHIVMFRLVFTILVLATVTSARMIDDYGRNTNHESVPSDVTEDDALFLTPYIEKGQIKKAQELAVVKPLLAGVESFSGYLTVNESTSSNLFFWLFKSQLKDWEKQPLVIWLQGGPGGSSMFGLFTELGPFYVNKKQKLKKRKYSWNRKANLLFFDNPVGAGFSFTKSDHGYANDELDVSRDLYRALVQFYTLFPALQKNKLYITGESYAGKYIPAIAYKIHKENKVANLKLPLAGIMIGNAWTDPVNMIRYAVYLYQIGLIDKSLRDKFISKEEETKAYIRAGKFREALGGFDTELNNFEDQTGLHNPYDFVHDDVGSAGFEVKFIQSASTRKAIHVGNYPFNDGINTYIHLSSDIMKSLKPWVEELLEAEEFPILFYSGQLDIIVAYPLNLGFYNSLQWPHAKDYHSAERCLFKVGNEVAGYYKSAGSFTEVLVRNTGHMVPTTQPKWAFELLDRFMTNSSSFLACH